MLFKMTDHDLTLEMNESHYEGYRRFYEYKLAIGGKVIFEGNDFSSGIPDDESDLISLLGFLTVPVGDTDAEYFQNHTQEQLDFTESDAAEAVRMLCYDYEYSQSIDADDPDYECVMKSVETIKAAIVA